MISRNQLTDYLRTHWINDVDSVATGIQAWLSTINVPAKTVVTHTTTPSTSRSEAGRKAAATRTAARTWVSRDGKSYVVFSRDDTNGVRVPRTFVRDRLGASPGDNVLIVGTKGISSTSLTVRRDGSLYVGSSIINGFKNLSFRFRTDNGKLVIKA